MGKSVKRHQAQAGDLFKPLTLKSGRRRLPLTARRFEKLSLSYLRLTVNYIVNLTLTSLSSTTNLNRAGFSFSIFNSGLLDMRAKNCFDCLETWIMRDKETENCQYNSVNRKQLKNEANLQRGTAPDLLQMTAAATAEHKQNKPHCFFNLKSPPCACSWKYS